MAAYEVQVDAGAVNTVAVTTSWADCRFSYPRGGPISVKVVDADGRPYLSSGWAVGELRLDLAPGIYLFQVRDSENNRVRRELEVEAGVNRFVVD